MLIALRLILFEFPEPPEDRLQLLLVRHGEVIGRRLGLGVRDVAKGIIESVELIMEIVQCTVDAFTAFGLACRGFHHTGQIHDGFDARCPLRLICIVACSGIEQVAAAGEAGQ